MPQMKRIPEYLRLLQKGADPDSVMPPSNEVPEPTGDYRRIQEYGKGAPTDVVSGPSDEEKMMEVFKKYNPNQPSLEQVLKNKQMQQQEDQNVDDAIKEFGINDESGKKDKLLPKLRSLIGK